MKTRFVFFDLGNVLLRFSIERMARQGAETVGCAPEKVLEAVFGGGMQRRVECGLVTESEFYESFCRTVGNRPDPNRLADALNDIFSVLDETQPFLNALSSRNFPRGILSNVGTAHWNHCIRTYPFLLRSIPDNHVLSFRVGAMKPEREIFEAALHTARNVVTDIKPGEILFIDDLEPNVAGAREFGFDAVPFLSAGQLAEEVNRRNLNG